MIHEHVFDGELIKEDVGTANLMVNPNYRNLALVCRRIYTSTSDALFIRMHTYRADTPRILSDWLQNQPYEQRDVITSLEFADKIRWNNAEKENGYSFAEKKIGRNPPAWFTEKEVSFKKKGFGNLKRIHLEVVFDTGLCEAFVCSPQRREYFREEADAAMEAWTAQLKSWNPGVAVSISSDSIRLRLKELEQKFPYLFC
jgi:hypothetical protein